MSERRDQSDEDSWVISIFVPEGAAAGPAADPADPAQEHSLGSWLGWGRVEEVKPQAIRGQWQGTIRTLLNLTSSVGEQARGWKIDEIEVGLTLSAKGELLFIAEAGAEASIKIKLTRNGISQRDGDGAAGIDKPA